MCTCVRVCVPSCVRQCDRVRSCVRPRALKFDILFTKVNVKICDVEGHIGHERKESQ